MKFLIEKVTLVGANGTRLKNVQVKDATNDLEQYRKTWWNKYPHAEAITLTYHTRTEAIQHERLKTTKELYDEVSDYD